MKPEVLGIVTLGHNHCSPTPNLDLRAMALGDPSLPAVLLTNDDGIDAPGIKALAAVLGNAGFCRVLVIAPDV